MNIKYYKIFFTISFIYETGDKKRVSKSFKSDVDMDTNSFDENIDDKVIYKKWTSFALNKSINLLNPPSKFDDKKISEKKVITHRIVNLSNLTEVF